MICIELSCNLPIFSCIWLINVLFSLNYDHFARSFVTEFTITSKSMSFALSCPVEEDIS